MRDPRFAAAGLATLAFLGASIATGTVAGQSRTVPAQAEGAARASSSPRTSWGAPDLQGTWSFATVTPLERPDGVTKEFLTAEEIAEIERKAIVAATDEARGADAARDVAGAYNDFWWDRGTRVAGRRSSLIVDPPTGKIPPLTAEARKWADSPEAKRIQETRRGNLPAASYTDTDLWDRCLTRGLPIVPGPYNNNIQIFQTPTHVVIHHEMVHDARIVPLDNRPHLPSSVSQWFGSARGRWDGDTLVVESRNFNEQQELPFEPRMSAAGMTLTERFSRSPDGTLRYEFAVNHPKVYSRPWTAVLQMTPADGEVFEYACHEGNHAMEGILKGSRLIEKNAEEAARKGAR
jgi:hypothetical protein